MRVKTNMNASFWTFLRPISFYILSNKTNLNSIIYFLSKNDHILNGFYLVLAVDWCESLLVLCRSTKGFFRASIVSSAQLLPRANNEAALAIYQNDKERFYLKEEFV